MNSTAAPSVPKGYMSVQNYTPGQMEVFGNQFKHLDPNSMTGKLASGDQSAFAEIEAPAMRQFSQLQGENASRFSGAGMGARRGSGFQNYQSQATSDFAQDLASKRQGLQRQAIQDLMGFSSQILGQQPYDLMKEDPANKKKSWWQKLLGGAAPLVGAAGGFLAGGPAGALTGYNLGNSFGEAFQ